MTNRLAAKKPAGTEASKLLGTTIQDAMARTMQEFKGDSNAADILYLPLQNIVPNPEQPRRFFDELRLQELATSIQHSGVQQPIMVRPIAEGKYEIVFGERRYRASHLAGLSTIPAMVRELTPDEAQIYAITENLQREDLSPFEEAQFRLLLIARVLDKSLEEVPPYLRQLHRRLGQRQELEHPEHVELLEKLFQTLGGSWRSFAVHGLRVLNLPPSLTDALRTGQLEYSKALAIQLAPTEHYDSLIHAAIDQSLTLTQIQERVRALTQTNTATEPIVQLRARLTTRKLAALPENKQLKAHKLIAALNSLFID